jgi:hypothetical protein
MIDSHYNEPSNSLLDTIYNNSSISYGRSRNDIKDDFESDSFNLGKLYGNKKTYST